MEIIDLTHPLHNGMIKFDAPWHIETDIRAIGNIAEVGRNTCVITIGSHAGTHMDAAKHFDADGESVDQISLNRLIGPVTVVDFSHKTQNSFVTKEDLLQIRITKRMLFHFNWDIYWNTKQFYKEYPYFTSEAAQYLVDCGVSVIGIDTPSPDDSAIVLQSKDDSHIHKLFLKQGVTLIEYLANLGKVVSSTKQWMLCALPLPILGGDGSPIRACLISMD